MALKSSRSILMHPMVVIINDEFSRNTESLVMLAFLYNF